MSTLPSLPPSLTVRELLDLVARDQLDVPPIQRYLRRSSVWVAELIDSLWDGISIGLLLLWAPEKDHRPNQGRYRDNSKAPWWILDGQQRISGLLGAFGIRPPWIPDPVWDRMGGPRLRVAIAFDSNNNPVFRPIRPDAAGHVPLGELISPDSVAKTLQRHGLAGGELVERFTQLRDHLLNAEIAVAWLPGDLARAAKGFERHNKQPDSNLKSEELSLCLLSVLYPRIQPHFIDVLVSEAQDRGMGKVVTRRRVSTVIENMLPAKVSDHMAMTKNLSARDVERAAKRMASAGPKVLDYLARYGITHQEVFPAPSTFITLTHLFDLFPQAVQDDFARRWLVHWIGRNTFITRKRKSSSDAYAIRKAGTYEQAKAALIGGLPEGEGAEFSADRLLARPNNNNYGPDGFLYAMACAEQICGEVRDLYDARIAFPDARLRLHPLCLRANHFLLVQHAFMTDQAAEIINREGWTMQAYQALRCSDEAVRAQMLPMPDPKVKPNQIGAWLIEKRGPMIAKALTRFLNKIGTLRGPEHSQ